MVKILALLFAFVPGIAFACEPVQWIAGVTATHQGIFPAKRRADDGINKDIPWTVPFGKTLGITSILFSSKHLSSAHAQASYLTIYPFLSVPSNIGYVHFSPPFRIAELSVIDFQFANAPGIGQNMFGAVTGWLSDFEDMRDCPM